MNSMALALQIAFFLAAIAIVIFVAFCIPAIIQMRKHATQMAQTMAELKVEVSAMVQDSRKVLHNVNVLALRAHEQCDDGEDVLQTVRGWTDRMDRVVDEVGAAIEPPVLAAARNAQVVYKGIAKFFQTFLKRNHNNTQKVED